MPTKEWLLDNFETAADILSYASENHGVCPTLKYVKHLTGGLTEVQCCDADNRDNSYTGTGSNKKEAIADCISKKFPS